MIMVTKILEKAEIFLKIDEEYCIDCWKNCSENNETIDEVIKLFVKEKN